VVRLVTRLLEWIVVSYQHVFLIYFTFLLLIFFFPSVEDPYLQGRIGCANVLSDLYACGVTHCDNLLMLVGVCDGMTVEQQDTITLNFMQGFGWGAREGGTRVTGGQTVINSWPLIGGVAMSVVRREELIVPEGAVPGDVLVLTKALGTQVASNVHQWLEKPDRWQRIEKVMEKEEALVAFVKATRSMCRLNKVAAELMHKYKAHAATDVTGFGILGHANNLVRNQKADVDFIIDTLPIIAKMKAVDEIVNFGLRRGTSAETSGGLLVCLSSHSVALDYIKEIKEKEGEDAWIVGNVVKRNGSQNTAIIVENPKIVEV